MTIIEKYRITAELYKELNKSLVRAVDDISGKNVILKIIPFTGMLDPACQEIEQEFAFGSAFSFTGILNYTRILRPENYLVLEMDDFEGCSLESFLTENRLSIPAALHLATSLTLILEELQYHGISHSDLRPAHFLVNPETFQARLIDLSSAAGMDRKEQNAGRNTNLTALQYMSPEQSGLTDTPVDFRSEYYNLGVMFYQLFTGVLPFENADPNELVHAHMARTPTNPSTINPEIPSCISSIILKLIAKKPSDRYQTTRGIRADLATCLENFLKNSPNTHFQIGGHDFPGQFGITEKLYGRDRELDLLLAAFERSGDRNEMFLVSGNSGIGKSSLIRALQKRVEPRALFITGKFDQYLQNVPFEAIIQAFKELICKISHQDATYWKAQILDAVGQFGQIIVDVIPDLEKMIGKQPAVETLTPIEAQNRFVNVFTGFINVFTKKEHPLVIFLDDLHWADPSSLRFLSRVTYSVEGSNLFITGTYRDNELSEKHPLRTALKELDTADSNLSQLTLYPLQPADITALISDTFSCPPKVAAQLADMVFTRTLGNPFFVSETLKDLVSNELVRYNTKLRKWTWDQHEVRGYALSGSSQQLLTSKINNLREPARQALVTASCIGSDFDLLILSALNDKTPQEISEDLREAVAENLLQLSDERGNETRFLNIKRYRFVHDQVQQAAYNLLSVEARSELHVNIGYFLLERLSAAERYDQLFEIVNHLNHHQDFAQPGERYKIAELNFEAGKKARSSAAYSVAMAYFRIGKELLVWADWTDAYQLALDLHLHLAESAYLAGDAATCMEVAETALVAAKNEDKIKLYQIQIQSLIFHEQPFEAISLSLKVLKELNVTFPVKAKKWHTASAYLKSKWLMRGKKIEALENLPQMTAPNQLAAMRFLQNITAASFSAIPELYPLMVLKMVELSLKYGIAPESAITFATYGAIVNAIEYNHDACYRYGNVALKLADRFENSAARARTLLIYNIVNRSSGQHTNEVLEPLRVSYQTGIEMGDVEYCSYASSTYSFHLLLSGKNLHWVKHEILRYNQLPRSLSKGAVSHHNEPLIQIASNLLGENEDPVVLTGEYFDEGEAFSGIFALKNNSRMFVCFAYKLALAYLSGELERGLALTRHADAFAGNVRGSQFESLFSFFFGLLNIALYKKGGNNGYLKTAAKHRDKIRKLSRQVPINLEHRFYLMEAELFAANGNTQQAVAYYDKAIKTGIENGHLHEAALANELCGKFWQEKGQVKMALSYLSVALDGYREWGCVIKERHLLAEFPALSQGFQDHAAIISPKNGAGESIVSTLDLATLMKTSTAISSEVVFGRLLEKLMQFAIENAGAQSGYFILDWGGELYIEARRSVIDGASDIRKIRLADSDQLPASMIEHVFNTKSDVVLHDALASDVFKNDPIVIQREIRSVLCIPALNQGKLVGVLYLENNLATAVFTNERTQLLKLLSGQIAVSIENAILYEKLEQKVAVRTAEIQVQKEEIERQKLLVEEKSKFKEQFFANMSHEIRTPMTAILGMSELIFDTQLDAKQTEYAKGIRYSSENLLAIINDILDYSKIEAGKFSFVNKPFQVRDRMNRLGYILRVIAEEKGLKLAVTVDEDVSQQLIGDPIRLHQILLNLAGNAVKFTDNGLVSIKVSVVNKDRESEELLFEVIDTGIGIAEDKLAYIFETFTRIDDDLNTKQSGTGLGLFIAKKLVEEQGGSMQVNSTLGKGTRFSFNLTFEVCSPGDHVEDGEEDSNLADVSILLVEDNLFNQVVAEETLKKIIQNVRVTIADNGENALRKLDEASFDIILMDVKMPVMDGYKATRAIRGREKDKHTPILAFTSNANPAEAQKCRDAGMDDYITKPIEAKKLKYKIRKLLKGAIQTEPTS
ncbi:hybrid sensor histidine kinase/response regulator [Dyadobacter sp. CY343]|uniref:hybrid sensor histidine kinase/response regulator n=1 Tax=Dyadobacter sp. CY343 TaxID=2907299 RepID=UPI001F1F85B2|nr:hybrid sensor histidine kinase/response regulator [Dyadobacter sp. CY343]MCE7062212.1 AAA family ATPase [Dyadobacter sp. CY343]